MTQGLGKFDSNERRAIGVFSPFASFFDPLYGFQADRYAQFLEQMESLSVPLPAYPKYSGNKPRPHHNSVNPYARNNPYNWNRRHTP